MSHWGDSSKCWNELLTQKTYIVLLQPSYDVLHQGHSNHNIDGRIGRTAFKARYDEPFGAAIPFSNELERRILEALGKN